MIPESSREDTPSTSSDRSKRSNDTDGSPAGFTMQTAEKTFAGYTLTVRNRGGHSSKPRKDNAIYSLAHALDKIDQLSGEGEISFAIFGNKRHPASLSRRRRGQSCRPAVHRVLRLRDGS